MTATAAKDSGYADLRRHAEGRAAAAKTDRFSWWLHWAEIAKYLLPRRYKFLIQPNQYNRGSPINNGIYDSTPIIAHRNCAAGMMSGNTSPGKPWFKLTLGKSQQVADRPWLDEVQARMSHVMAESNYYQAKHVQYQDLSAFGTAPLLIYEDFQDVIRCQNPCAGEYYALQSNRLEVDSLFREFTYTVGQIVQEFGRENCPEDIQRMYERGGGELNAERIVWHAIEPNDIKLGGAVVPRGFPYREAYWINGSAAHEMLRVKGFHEAPFSCPRWDVTGNDAYGRSPAMDALPDIKELYSLKKRKGQGVEKMVNPPMIASANMASKPMSTLPGGVTFDDTMDPRSGFRPAYMLNLPISELREDIAGLQESVRDVFFNPLFQMISELDAGQMTATEVNARQEEKLIMLGPVLERNQNESLSQDINRIYGIMMRAGLLPPPPANIQGREIRVEYMSMLSQAQRAASTTAIERVFAFAGNLVGVYPDVKDNLDEDQAIETYCDLMSTPSSIVRSPQAVAKIRQAKIQAQAQAQAEQQTQALVQGAQTLSQTDVGGGQNALAAMLGNAGGSPQQMTT